MKVFLVFCILLIQTATSAFAEGKIKLYAPLEFADGTSQTTATVQGPVGLQGAKGDTGPPGPMSDISIQALSSICDLYNKTSSPYPAFCSTGCDFSEWSSWSDCTAACDTGSQTRTRSLVNQPIFQPACPPLQEIQSCNTQTCPNKKIFVTSQSWNGNLGGLDGADAKCQLLAQGAGLAGTYKAWLSGQSIYAKDRLTFTTGFKYVTTNGVLIAIDSSEFLSTKHQNPIILDENGLSAVKNVWTHTDHNGNKFLTQTACLDWQDNTSNNRAGIGHSYEYSTLSWTVFGSDYCNSTAGLYCIEQ